LVTGPVCYASNWIEYIWVEFSRSQMDSIGDFGKRIAQQIQLVYMGNVINIEWEIKLWVSL
jgi:hypothetical protein